MYKPQFRTKQNGVPVISKKEIEVIGENFLRDFCPDALINPQPVDIERFLELYLGLKIDYQFLSNDGRYLGMMVFNDTDKVIIYNPEKNEADYIHADARTVLIDNRLLEENQEHRYRYTVGHECGHDIFHSGFYSYNPNQISLFDNSRADDPAMVQCRVVGQSSFGAQKFWTDAERMEWHSNYFSSVMLMPKEAVKKVAGKPIEKKSGLNLAAYAMIQRVAQQFNVSPEAAQYRLEELGCLGKGLVQDASFLGYGVTILPT